ncbi:MAG TPA: putative metal-binding motif-containing protein [Kofleriaceae bacterium]|nr:putative metal-binding motif-containing protein [Kofleriaceae bacterium]
MRSLCLAVALGSLAGCTDAGAHLTFSAPQGPGQVTSFQVVLATPDQVPSIAGQRTSASGLEEQSVSYYLQRTIAGGTHGKIDGVDGFAVRVEPDPSMVETQFIPFVLMYEGDKIVAVATFHAADRVTPSPILVLRDEIDKYVLDVEPVAQVDDMVPAAVSQVRTVECFREDQSTFTSGIVWRTAGGAELRLLFPDDGGLDATGRALDLDCDHHPVAVDTSGRDCDDSRAWFHNDAQETCDGFDTNCDGLQSLVVACDGNGVGGGVCTDPTTNTGLALCDDRTGTESACESDPQCLCAANPQLCARCVLTTELGTSTTTLKPCQPGVGYMHLEMCNDTARCSRVEVVKTGGGWKAEVAADGTNLAFASVATNVGGKVFLRVKRPEGPGVEIPGQRGTSTGDVMLAVTSADGSTHLRAIDLQFDVDGGTCTGSGPYAMLCYP